MNSTKVLSRQYLEAYRSFQGDMDGWARSAESKSNPALTELWPAISELLMNLRAMQVTPVTSRFRDEVNEHLQQLTHGNVLLVSQLESMARDSK